MNTRFHDSAKEMVDRFYRNAINVLNQLIEADIAKPTDTLEQVLVKLKEQEKAV